jgi:hypothetical protein
MPAPILLKAVIPDWGQDNYDQIPKISLDGDLWKDFFTFAQKLLESIRIWSPSLRRVKPLHQNSSVTEQI